MPKARFAMVVSCALLIGACGDDDTPTTTDSSATSETNAPTDTVPNSTVASTSSAVDSAVDVADSTVAPDTTDSTTAPPNEDAVALEYTGGTPGPADSSLEPLVIGYVNQEGGVPSFPDATRGIGAAVRYVNERLGGVEGHPVELATCFVASEEDGQRCGTEMANNDDVKFVISGQLTAGGGVMYSILNGKKPVLIGNVAGSDDLQATDAYSFSSGGPGALAGIATFVGTAIDDVDQVAVIYGDNPAARATVDNVLKSTLEANNVENITLVPVPEAATAPEFAAAIQAAGGSEADVLIPYVFLPGCIATYDALKSLGIEPAVVTGGTCAGQGVTDHLADLGIEDQVPNGWYFGDPYGESPFAPGEGSGMETLVSVLRTYEPEMELATLPVALAANLLTAVRFANEMGVEGVTSEAMRDAIVNFEGPMITGGRELECAFSSMFPSLCSRYTGMSRYLDGEWLPVARGEDVIDVGGILGG